MLNMFELGLYAFLGSPRSNIFHETWRDLVADPNPAILQRAFDIQQKPKNQLTTIKEF